MKEESSNVMAFDALYTNNQIQKLKVLLPYVEPSMQKNMAIYIKYMELKYTMDLCRKHPFHICSAPPEESPPDVKRLCQELKPYCTEAEVRQLEQMGINDYKVYVQETEWILRTEAPPLSAMSAPGCRQTPPESPPGSKPPPRPVRP